MDFANRSLNPHSTRLFTALLLAGVVILTNATGCTEEEGISAYRAPKDPPTPEPTPQTASTSGGSSQSRPGKMLWDVPEGWNQVGEESGMRMATFEVGDSEQKMEIVVTAFSGQVGDLLGNLNRWRGQVGLDEPLKPEDIDAFIDTATKDAFENPGVAGMTMEIQGEVEGDAKAMIISMLRSFDSRTWFVKGTSSPDVVSAQTDQFLQFVRSFRMTVPGGNDPGTVRPTRAKLTIPTWTQPEHWIAEESKSAMIHAAYNIKSDDASARVTVTPLAGDGGGILANFNRWRGQVGLSPIKTIEDQPADRFDVDGAFAAVLDLSEETDDPESDEAKARTRILVAMVLPPSQDQAWFFKMTGPYELLETEKEGFMTFVKSIQFKGEDS